MEVTKIYHLPQGQDLIVNKAERVNGPYGPSWLLDLEMLNGMRYHTYTQKKETRMFDELAGGLAYLEEPGLIKVHEVIPYKDTAYCRTEFFVFPTDDDIPNAQTMPVEPVTCRKRKYADEPNHRVVVSDSCTSEETPKRRVAKSESVKPVKKTE